MDQIQSSSLCINISCRQFDYLRCPLLLLRWHHHLVLLPALVLHYHRIQDIFVYHLVIGIYPWVVLYLAMHQSCFRIVLVDMTLLVHIVHRLMISICVM